MVRHGTNKKRRRGIKVTRKAPKHRVVKIANSVVNPHVKNIYDKNITPEENLKKFGLQSNINSINNKSSNDNNSSYAGFVGYGEVMDGTCYVEKNPKRKKISDFDKNYIVTLINKHNDNYSAMEKDIVINNRQLTANQLKRLYQRYHEDINDK